MAISRKIAFGKSCSFSRPRFSSRLLETRADSSPFSSWPELFGQDLAGGPYHIISGYLSFPFAIGAMLLFSKLLNIKPARVKSAALQKDPVSYDY